jgi:alkanesulfonate monooxygenase SsuD/methylene tetrahydromethanopterin reductase-like flavin-dependent oxidoreductase (luciferase family)
MAKQLLLNAFNMNCVGHINHGLWTHPRDRSVDFNRLDYWTDLARLLERGLFDGLFLADILGCRVDRPSNFETTALGAAFLAGLATGVWGDLEEVSRTWSAAQSFEPAMEAEQRRKLLRGRSKALERTLT